tara:strand:+ start:1229 stop:1564 length:336 start_codon:yes stop_codon:yes gene_type:complete
MRIVKAFRHSIDGVREAIVNHTAFRQELIITTVLFPIAIWLGQNGIERSILIGTLLIILIVELINSAIESTVDRIGKDKNILSKKAKDLGSAAVFIAIANAILMWILVLFQ